jgi:hypothetical protein
LVARRAEMILTRTSSPLVDSASVCTATHLEFERTFLGEVRVGLLPFGIHADDALFDNGLNLTAKTDWRERSVCAEPTTDAAEPLPANMVAPDEEAGTSR